MSSHVELQCADVHRQEVRYRQLVVFEVSVYVELVNFIQAFDVLICGLMANTVTFKDSHVDIRTYHTCAEVLTSYGDTAGTDEGVINEVTYLTLGLVCHKKGQLMVSAGRT